MLDCFHRKCRGICCSERCLTAPPLIGVTTQPIQPRSGTGARPQVRHKDRRDNNYPHTTASAYKLCPLICAAIQHFAHLGKPSVEEALREPRCLIRRTIPIESARISLRIVGTPARAFFESPDTPSTSTPKSLVSPTQLAHHPHAKTGQRLDWTSQIAFIIGGSIVARSINCRDICAIIFGRTLRYRKRIHLQ